mmetsp:Transcript_102839/g.290789  ORF Transcript_102839/g.290789 Transcript_102839/m.290789 type:complete len:88 (+) Transcript_102839:1948-2211(+)
MASGVGGHPSGRASSKPLASSWERRRLPRRQERCEQNAATMSRKTAGQEVRTRGQSQRNQQMEGWAAGQQRPGQLIHQEIQSLPASC